MKKLLSLAVFLLLSISVFAQYPEVTIRDIQYQDPSTLITYWDDDFGSSLDGDTVTITGIVMVPPYKAANPDSGVLMYCGGGNAGFYIQDTSETDWSGLLVIQSSPISPEFQYLDSGTVVKITGYVEEYVTATQKTTEMFVIGFDASNIIDFKKRPEPVELTLDSLKELGTNDDKAISEKWEGVYVIIRNVTTFDRNTNGGFRIYDSNNTQLNIGTKSNYYYQNQAPPDGTVLEYIKGYIETRSVSSGGITLNPGWRDDMKILQYSPAISNINRNPVLVGYGDPVTVSAVITDQDGTITSAKLFYRKNMTTYNELAMNNVSGDTWQAVIPAQNDSSFIDFYVWAQDDDNNTTTYPPDEEDRYFYLVLDRPLTIQDVQYSPLGGGYSGYNGYDISVRGIVTADTTDLQGDGGSIGPKVYLQNGSGSWSGIWISGTETLLRRRGDDVTVTGTVEENFSVTRIGGIDNPGNIQVHATGQPLPDPEILSTATIDLLSNGSVQAEQWESVLIKYEDIDVIDENADGSPGPGGGGNNNFGEMLVADASTQVTRVELQDGTHHYHNFWTAGLDTIPGNIRIQTGDFFDGLIGILYFSFGNYKLTPRKDDDFVGYTSDVSYQAEVPDQFELSQNYPNPFNPSTRINFSIPVDANVSLKIYDILGREVSTLADNEFKSAGQHTVNFDASNLPSGIYFYRLQAGDFVQVRKMMLLK